MTSSQPPLPEQTAGATLLPVLQSIGAYRDGAREAEMRRAARTILQTRRRVWQAAALFVVIGAGCGWIFTLPGALEAPGAPVPHPLAVAALCAAIAAGELGNAVGRNLTTHRWLMSLRRLDPMLPFLAPDVPLHRWAAAFLRGERHAPGEIERALMALWADDSSEKERALARLVLARRHIPNVSEAPFEADRRSHFPLWLRHVADPADAPGAEIERDCTPCLVGVADGAVIQRCACGGIKAWDGRWLQRDDSWHEECVGAAGGRAS